MTSLALKGDDLRNAGILVGINGNAKTLLVTSGQCIDAALKRFGSEAALRAAASAHAAASPKTNISQRLQVAGHLTQSPVYGLVQLPPRAAWGV
jgi:hypothetical protein